MLEECFLNYKNITKEIINNIDNEEYVLILINKRQAILDDINKIDIEPKEKEKCYKSLEIDKDDELLKKYLEDSLVDIKDKIKKARVGKKALNSYVSANRQGSLFSRDV